jgi:uncharacterized UBP type Zn finger protein
MNTVFDASSSNNVYDFMIFMLKVMEIETKTPQGNLIKDLFEIGITRCIWCNVCEN